MTEKEAEQPQKEEKKELTNDEVLAYGNALTQYVLGTSNEMGMTLQQLQSVLWNLMFDLTFASKRPVRMSDLQAHIQKLKEAKEKEVGGGEK